MSTLEDDLSKDADLEEKNAFLHKLLDDAHVEHPAAIGIIRQVIGQGEESLSDSQLAVYQLQVIEKYIDVECVRCHKLLNSWAERSEALDNDGRCSYCEYQEQKDD